jgi:hypothetical protein
MLLRGKIGGGYVKSRMNQNMKASGRPSRRFLSLAAWASIWLYSWESVYSSGIWLMKHLPWAMPEINRNYHRLPWCDLHVVSSIETK